MPNDISIAGLTEIVFQSKDTVLKEPTGFAQGVMINADAAGASSGGTIASLRTTQPTLETSYAPSMVPPDTADIATLEETLTLNLVAGSRIPLKGETVQRLTNTVGYDYAIGQMIQQAIRTIQNQIEASIADTAYKGSSRAVGTAGTTPFGSNFNAINEARQILEDNGAPMDDGQFSLVISSAAGTNLRNLATLTKANEAGNDATLRRGELLNVAGFSIRTSAGVRSHTKGTGSGYLVNQTGLTTGSRAITTDTGTGTIVAGDIITFASGAGSGRNYVVGGALASNIVTLNHPGLQGAIADNNAITVGNNYVANVGFHKSAIELAMRPPAQPAGGDAGEEIAVISDPLTGLTFSARLYRGRGMNILEIYCLYGVKVWKPELVATIMG